VVRTNIKPAGKPQPKAAPSTEEVTQNKPPVRTKAPPKKSARSKVTRAQAIKFFCWECMGYNRHFVKACTVEVCPLWPYRTGSGYQDTDKQIYVPEVWPKDILDTSEAPEDNR
jgi:hypothetical protein